MRKLYIHIGVTKTGTTALQTFFFKSADFLLKHGILYPNPDGDPINSQAWVGNAYTFAEPLYSGTFDKAKIEECIVSMARQADESDKNVLLSCEAFSSIASSDTVEFICSTLDKHFEIAVIVFVRDPLNWSYSIWKQFVKGNGETQDFLSFMQAYPEQWPHCETWLEYIKDLHIFSYEEHKDDILAPTLKALGIDVDAEELNSLSATGLSIDNRSLSDSELAFFREFNKVDALRNSPNLRWDIFHAFLERRPEPAPCAPPNPQYAPLAEAKHEDFFRALAPYMPRDKIIMKSRAPYTDDHKNMAALKEAEVQLALSVIANRFPNYSS